MLGNVKFPRYGYGFITLAGTTGDLSRVYGLRQFYNKITFFYFVFFTITKQEFTNTKIVSNNYVKRVDIN